MGKGGCDGAGGRGGGSLNACTDDRALRRGGGSRVQNREVKVQQLVAFLVDVLNISTEVIL